VVLRLLERSGQSVAEFCREQDLPYGVVSRWRREARAADGSGVRWVEVEAAAESAPPTPSRGKDVDLTSVVAEVSLGGGVMIRVYRQEGGAC
jgi:transposase-like protein